MCRGGDRGARNERQRLKRDARIREVGRGDRQSTLAFAKRGDRRPERCRPQLHAERRVGVAQIFERRGGKSKRKLRVKSDCEVQFDTFAEAKRPRPHGVDLEQYGAHVGEQRPALARECRPVARDRSKSAILSWFSRLLIAWLTADWTRDRRPAAARKLPDSATATKTRI